MNQIQEYAFAWKQLFEVALFILEGPCDYTYPFYWITEYRPNALHPCKQNGKVDHFQDMFLVPWETQN